MVTIFVSRSVYSIGWLENSKYKKDNSYEENLFTALTAVIGISALIIAKRRKDVYSDEKIRQAEEYNSAITKALTDEDLCDFNDFAAALSEYYGITAKCVDCETVEYSSDKYSAVLTSNDIIRTRNGTLIQLECMSQLKCFFLPN